MSTERPLLEEMTLRQLRRVASEYGVSRYSRMRKDQLLISIQEAQRYRFSSSSRPVEAQADVEAAKFDVGQADRAEVSLTAVDEGLAELPEGYAESCIVLMPRDPQWAYTYWDISNAQKQELRYQGGSQLALRFYDVTDINIASQKPHSLQQYECDELSREWYLPVPVSDREYMVEIGYLTGDGRWLLLARSTPARIPPVYPSDWIDDQFIAVSWDEDLRSQTFLQLVNPTTTKRRESSLSNHEEVFSIAKSAEEQRVAGSVLSSVQQVPEQAVSSYVFPSGAGIWASAVPTTSGIGMTASGLGMSGAGLTAGFTGAGAAGMTSGMGMSGVGVTGMTMSGMGMSGMTMSGMTMSGIGMSGIGMSGVGMMSGIGFSASAPLVRARQFWLVADAELIVYGATEPDAKVTIGGHPVQLNSDGTFRFQMSFQDGMIDFPIFAIAADGEQNRAVHLKFERETPERRTNPKEEAIPEWVMG